MAAQPPGEPLQLISLNMKENSVEVNEDALGRLEKRLKACPAKKIAVVSVMGAFRTGKSFLLDLFLRYLRYEEKQHQETGVSAGAQPSQLSADAKLGTNDAVPDWLQGNAESLEGGVGQNHEGGFRFKGGMDFCTEGIWIWSEPFVRKINGQDVAVLLMDTQGAWDSQMTKTQSATIFGLTAVLSSKQIYNVNLQIQEDNVQNLAYFMNFAQAALEKATNEIEKSGNKVDASEIAKPFQSLDFLVRDWKNFGEDWPVAKCKEQMREHLSKHVHPDGKDAVKALHDMFHRINCFCLPHPGLVVRKETWEGNVSDLDKDFVMLLSHYVRDVFAEGLDTKSILGSEFSTLSFPMILREFVVAFKGAAPAAMGFTQAMQNCTQLLAKETCMKTFTQKMDEAAASHPRGLDRAEFDELSKSVRKTIEQDYGNTTIFGSRDTREETWTSISRSLDTLCQEYCEANARRLEKALAAFATIAIAGVLLFGVDRISDWTCDWWSQTCVHLSSLCLMANLAIFGYIGVYVFLLMRDRGRLGTAIAIGELSKEMMRLIAVYAEVFQKTKMSEYPDLIKAILSGKTSLEAEAVARAAKVDNNKEPDNKKKN